MDAFRRSTIGAASSSGTVGSTERIAARTRSVTSVGDSAVRTNTVSARDHPSVSGEYIASAGPFSPAYRTSSTTPMIVLGGHSVQPPRMNFRPTTGASGKYWRTQERLTSATGGTLAVSTGVN